VDVDIEVVVQESQSVLDRVHLISNETLEKIVRRSLKNGPIEHSSHQGLDFSIEIIDGSVERDGGSINPSKDTVVNGCLDGVNFVVDRIGVERRLVIHALINRIGDSIREVRNGGCGVAPGSGHQGPKGKELNLDRQNSEKSNEKTSQSGRVENVVEEPPHVDMLGRGHPNSRRENIRNLRHKRMLRISSEHHHIVVAESDLRGGWRRLGVYHQGRIGRPRLTGVFEMSLHTSPLVPDKKAIESDEEKSEGNKDEDPNFSGFDQTTSNVVDNGGVEIVTKRKSILIRNGQKSMIKREASKSIINVLFQEFKGSIDAGSK